MNLNSMAVRKVLPRLALRPGEGFTLTDICRFSGLDTKSVNRVLEQFRVDGSLLDNAYGPRLAYRPATITRFEPKPRTY